MVVGGVEAAGLQATLTCVCNQEAEGERNAYTFTSALFSPGSPAWKMFPPVLKVGLPTSIHVVKIILHKLAQGRMESLWNCQLTLSRVVNMIQEPTRRGKDPSRPDLNVLPRHQGALIFTLPPRPLHHVWDVRVLASPSSCNLSRLRE